ncbi:TonB-dependent receptor [Sphingomonas sp.]|uniref:TonB-dependent receptor n=1 Tax=Sphingomonas sp. TaxID=28214 RepID=UPI00286E7D20|nr:TonB-dependent receptor [Sphingomonas sp.]
MTTFALSTVSLAALATSPAFAQTGAPVESTPEKTAEGEAVPPTSEPTNAAGQAAQEGDIVVTGSRIRRDNFNTPSPVTIVTRDDSVLAGTTSTAETLQSATITSGTSQISGGFLGFVSEGGAAANTVGLRGLGSQRTLVLLNGRRLAPAGVGNQLVAADLNVLPAAIVQRIEVLREGASAIYGSDAIAGVINVITDTKIDGITIDAFANIPMDIENSNSAGRTYRGSITAGKTFDRGHITASFEYRQLNGIRIGDQSEWECPRALLYQNGEEIGQLDPATGNLRCFQFQRGGGSGIASGYGLAFGDSTFGFPFFGRVTFPGYTTDNPTIGAPVIVNNNNLRPSPPATQLESHVVSPIKTYTAYVNGAYEIGALGDAEVYGEGLFTRRKSRQQGAVQLSLSTSQLNYEGAFYGGNFYGVPCADAIGAEYCNPFFANAFGDAGINYFAPFILPDQLQVETQRIDFFRGNVGIRGDVGMGDWRYDLNGQVSRTRAKANVPNPTIGRVSDVFSPVVAPAGTPSQYIVTALPGQAGAGIGYTCAGNVTGGAYNGGTCAPLNYFDPNILIGGDLPNAVFDYLYQDNINKTSFNQDTLSLIFDGTLMNLPAGAVKAAVGFEYRADKIDDRPSPAAIAGELYNRAGAGRTRGKDNVKEVFGEVNIPILSERPFFHSLEFAASGRYTDYKSYGSDFTYRLNGQWAPVEMLRFRASYGTNFRAPNLYEQFVADQTGFYGGSLDPCNGFGVNLEPGNATFDNCLAVLTPILDDPATPANEALGFVNTGSIEVTTRGGAGNLEAEHAKSWGLGAVFTMPAEIADFTLAVDYFNILVEDEVTSLGNTILNLCYGADDFPDNVYCQFIGPREGPDGVRPGALTTLDNPFLNVSRQTTKGIDFNARYATPLFGGRFQTQLQATRMLEQGLEIFDGAGLFDYNGTLGYPGFGSGPKWTGSLDTRFITGPLTFRWGVEYVGPASADKLVEDTFIGGQLVETDLDAEKYFEHGISVQYKWRNVGQITLGISNLFNEKPPTISDSLDTAGQYFRIGNSFGGGPYDYIGRSVFLNITKTF